MNWKKTVMIAGMGCVSIFIAGVSTANVEDLVVVYAPDDTIQCRDFPVPRPVAGDAKILKELGASVICAQGKVGGPYYHAAKCGLPTGQVNAFKIKKSDWETIKKSFVGPLAFKEWPDSSTPILDPTEECDSDVAVQKVQAPESTDAEVAVLVDGLVGRPLRCYSTGDALTDDFVSERVNIEKDKDGNIVQIWFG